MGEFRKLFPITGDRVYLNTAALAPLPAPVVDAIDRCLRSQMRRGSGAHDTEGPERLRALREKVAGLIGATGEEIAIVRNTSDGLGTVAAGLHWKAGDNVVIHALENPANVVPWANLRDRHGVELRMVPAREGLVSADDLLAAADERTRVIAASFVQWTHGFRMDLSALGTACRDRGIYCVVDAIQGLGVLPLDVRECSIDFLSAGAQKWMVGPMGIGCFFCRRELREEIWLSRPGYLSFKEGDDIPHDLRYTPSPGAERFEGGTPNIAGIHGFDAALDLIARAGVPRIERHVLGLTDRLIAGLRSRGCRIRSSLREEERSGIVSFTHPGRDSATLEQQLLARNIVVSVRAGNLRVSPHLFNTDGDIDRLLEALPPA